MARRGFSVQFNLNKEEDQRAVEIIDRLIREGYDFRDIVLECLRQCHDLKPSRSQSSVDMQSMLERFAQEIIAEIRQQGPRGIRGMTDDENAPDDTEVSSFMRNFAHSFVQRQQRATGEDES